MSKQHDAHVRARKRLVNQVIARWHEWGIPGALRPRKGARPEEWKALEATLMCAAEAAISGHRWNAGWGDKRTAYVPFPTLSGRPAQKVIGTLKDVPASEIHQLMVEAGMALNKRRSV